MATLSSESSSEPQRPPRVAPHTARAVAESFGTDAERYDRARPAYPAALIDHIVATSPGRSLLNVGCGTGIEARQFRAAGCTVLGVEPDARMADLARHGGVARGEGIEVEVATIETWDPAGRMFDAVVSGTAWHWVDPVAGAAKAAEVLRPGGLLAPFWHVFSFPPEIREVFAEVYERVVPNSPFNFRNLAAQGSPADAYQSGLSRVVDAVRGTGAFAEPEWLRYEWERTYTRDEWLDLLPTQGSLTRVPAEGRREIVDTVGAAVDRLGGSVTAPYTTIALTAVRADGT